MAGRYFQGITAEKRLDFSFFLKRGLLLPNAHFFIEFPPFIIEDIGMIFQLRLPQKKDSLKAVLLLFCFIEKAPNIFRIPLFQGLL
jgi:hypothetical protein